MKIKTAVTVFYWELLFYKPVKRNPITLSPAAPQSQSPSCKIEPFLPQVRQRGANMIHSVVDAEEAVNLMAKRG